MSRYLGNQARREFPVHSLSSQYSLGIGRPTFFRQLKQTLHPRILRRQSQASKVDGDCCIELIGTTS